jgi:hypothetical protein
MIIDEKIDIADLKPLKELARIHPSLSGKRLRRWHLMGIMQRGDTDMRQRIYMDGWWVGGQLYSTRKAVLEFWKRIGGK